MKTYIVKMVTSLHRVLAVECVSDVQAQQVAAWGKRSDCKKVKIQPTVPLSTKTTFVTVMAYADLPADWRYEIENRIIIGEEV